jgi:hypothetical protein
MRARWRLLRHDPAHPLGTIRSALSLMEDEALPAETRTGPRIRAMVSRNAGSLETLIAAGLDDALAEAIVSAPQEVSLRDVALAVRRTLREAARLAECEIVVEDALPSARVDEAAVELTLATLLLAGRRARRPGDVLRVGAEARRETRAGASSRCACGARRGDGEAARAWEPGELALPSALAGEYGGRVAARGRRRSNWSCRCCRAPRGEPAGRPPSGARGAQTAICATTSRAD